MIPAEQSWDRFRVFAERDDCVPVINIYLNFLAGAELDGPGQSGRTRLSAHMLRMGTRRMTREQITRAVEMLGADLDVSTSHHRVTVSGHVMTEMLAPFVELLDEVLNETGMREEDFEKLRRETLADIVAVRDDDQSLAYRHFRALLFSDHPYGRTTIGSHSEVSSLTFEQIQSVHHGALHAAPVIVGLSGDIDIDKMRTLLVPVLESFTRSSLDPHETADPEPPGGMRIRLVDKPARTQSQIYIGHLGLRADDPLYFPVALLNTAFGGTFTARLSREVRQNRGWSYGAYSRMLRSRQRDAFYLWTFPAMTDMVDCIELQIDMLRQLKAESLDQEEHEFARSYLVNHFLFALETASMRVALAMRQAVLQLPPEFYDNYRTSVLSVVPEQISEAARRFIDPDNLCICALCTADEVLPRLQEKLGSMATIEVVPWDADI